MADFIYKLFNPEKDDDISLRELFKNFSNQNSSGVYNLEKIKFNFAENFYQSQVQLI